MLYNSWFVLVLMCLGTSFGLQCDYSKKSVIDVLKKALIWPVCEENCSLYNHISTEASIHFAKDSVALVLLLSRSGHLSWRDFGNTPETKDFGSREKIENAIEIMSAHGGYIGFLNCTEHHQMCSDFVTDFFMEEDNMEGIMIHNYCSKKVAPSSLTLPDNVPDILDYLTLKVFERRVEILKDKNNIDFSVSTSEHMIPADLEAMHPSLIKDDLPLLLYTPLPATSQGFVQHMNMFLEVALTLRRLFAFHVVLPSLSTTRQEDLAAFRYPDITEHDSFCSLYTLQGCKNQLGQGVEDLKSWGFKCKPVVTYRISQLLSLNHFLSFPLFASLTSVSEVKGTVLKVAKKHPYLTEFLLNCQSYAILLLPTSDEGSEADVELLKKLSLVLHSVSNQHVYLVSMSKDVATASLPKSTIDNADFKAISMLSKPGFLIRLPFYKKQFILSDVNETAISDILVSIAKRSEELQDVVERVNQMRVLIQAEPISPSYTLSLLKMASYQKHNRDETLYQILSDGANVDAIVEQSRFSGVYNISQIISVEKDDHLRKEFFSKVGADKPWMVLFCVTWSAPCKAVRSIWSSVHECVNTKFNANVQLAKVDCFESNVVCDKLNIISYPQIFLFDKGEIIDRYSIDQGVFLKQLCSFGVLSVDKKSEPVISVNSDSAAEKMKEKYLSLMGRVFLLRGTSEIPKAISEVARDYYGKDVFLHLPSKTKGLELFFDESHYPQSVSYTGNLEDKTQLVEFITTAHHNSVFPLSLSHLASALQQNKPLIVIFSSDIFSEILSLSKTIYDRFSNSGLIGYLRLDNSPTSAKVVQTMAGNLLPSVNVFSRLENGSMAMFRCKFHGDSDHGLTCIDNALKRKLAGFELLPEVDAWKPAHTVFNFVPQVYYGVQSGDFKPSGRTPHSHATTTKESDESGNDVSNDENGNGVTDVPSDEADVKLGSHDEL